MAKKLLYLKILIRVLRFIHQAFEVENYFLLTLHWPSHGQLPPEAWYFLVVRRGISGKLKYRPEFSWLLERA